MNLSKIIEGTMLKPDIPGKHIVSLIMDAKIYGFAAVCVNPIWVKTASLLLEDSHVKVCTVIGFPLGVNTSKTKVFEVENAMQNGAEEIDVVINAGALKEGSYKLVEEEMESVIKAAEGKVLTKMIIDTSLLTEEKITRICEIAIKCEVDYIAVMNGLIGKTPVMKDIELVKKVVGSGTGIKVLGDIRNVKTAEALMRIGVTRIGTSDEYDIFQRIAGQE